MSYVGTEYSFPQLSRLTEKLHSIRGSKILVTGGGGFFGLHLGHLLHTLGAIVTLTDIRQPVQDVYSGIRFIQ
ncbi:short-chain dehydrogenase/reductase family 42E member 1-like, partial [Saccoglossus kowalevskii]